MTKTARLCCWRDWFYRLHVATGLVAAVWLLLIAVTGVLINHQESLGLLDMEINDRYLPGYYRPDVRTGTTRLNIVITDLHSGRIFGAHGHWAGDLIALLVVVSLTSGAFAYTARRRIQNGNPRKKPVPITVLTTTPEPDESSSLLVGNADRRG